MRIVIDTNIWVSGLLWRGPAWSLLKLAEQGQVILYISYPMLLELEEVLAYERFQPRLDVLQQTPARLAAYALNLAVALDVPRSSSPIVSADPDDDMFVSCAVAARADCLLTQDRHLLALKSYRGIPIIKLDAFLRQQTPA